ncbi:MAG: hypothetical protein PVJ15_03480 [Gammaproteobacteria bacterium]
MTPFNRLKTAQKRGAHRCRVSAILGLLYCLGISPAQGAEVIDAVLDGAFHEKLEADVNVSGNIIVGVMFSSAHLGLTSDALAILPSGGEATEICLKITSRDGTYTSENQFRRTGNPQAILRLPYQSRYLEVLNNYSRDDGSVAITATSGSCTQSATGVYYLPVRLDKRNQLPDAQDIRVYINGFDATDVSYQLKGAADWLPARDCDYIEEGRHTAYNFSCEIAEIPKNAATPVTVKILREVYGRELEPVQFSILTAD